MYILIITLGYSAFIWFIIRYLRLASLPERQFALATISIRPAGDL